jgi:hypothetical protein
MPNPLAQSVKHFHSRTTIEGLTLSFGMPQQTTDIVTYTDPIPLPGSLLGFLPNHDYQNMPQFNAYGQSKADVFGYETPPQFHFRSQPINMMPPRATAVPGVDPNNLTNQFAIISCESFDIEPRGRGRFYQKPYPDYFDQLPYHRGYRVPEFSKYSGEDGKTKLEVIESLSFLSLVGRMTKPH